MRKNGGGQFRAEIGWSTSSGKWWSISAENAVKGRFIDFTETVSVPSELKSYPDYYYLDPKVTNFPEEEHLLLFPNPSGDYVIAYFNSIDYGQKGAILIDDIQGKRIAEMQLDSQQNQVVINLTAYPNGIYFISLIINGKLIEIEKR